MSSLNGKKSTENLREYIKLHSKIYYQRPALKCYIFVTVNWEMQLKNIILTTNTFYGNVI